MLRRFAAWAMIAAGVICAGLAIGTATVWRPSDTVVATVKVPSGVPVVVTDPGVLNMVDPNVRVSVTATSSDQPIVIALARDSDASAWIGKTKALHITGMTDDWQLATKVSGTEPAAVNPAGSDLWLQETDGTGTQSWNWEDTQQGRYVLLVASDGVHQAASTIQFTWPRTVSTPFLIPGIAIGVILLIIGVIMVRPRRRHGRRGGRRAMTREPVTASATPSEIDASLASVSADSQPPGEGGSQPPGSGGEPRRRRRDRRGSPDPQATKPTVDAPPKPAANGGGAHLAGYRPNGDEADNAPTPFGHIAKTGPVEPSDPSRGGQQPWSRSTRWRQTWQVDGEPDSKSDSADPTDSDPQAGDQS